MRPLILQIPLPRLEAMCARPLTRDSVIDIAHRMHNETSTEVHIVVTVASKDEEPPIELATVELAYLPNDTWRLQYVSHPTQSHELTASIVPAMFDYVAFLQERKARQLSNTLSPVCAQQMEDEGQGPMAALNLRYGTPYPVVPSNSELTKLMALVHREAQN